MENTEKNIGNNNAIEEKFTIIPLVDVFEEKDGYTLYADMPGVSKENLELTLDNNELTIHGKVLDTEEYGSNNYSEFTTANFKRTFVVNDRIDTKNLSASIENGVFRLLLPKSEKTRPRKIEIKTA